MNQVSNLDYLVNLSYFDRNTIKQFVKLGENSLYVNIKRWLKQGYILRIKNGFYVTQKYYNNLRNKDIYVEFIANKLREPSYLSLEYVLHLYGILSEAVYSLTSITLKSKNSYQSKLGRFSYRNIKEKLFIGFDIYEKGEYQIKMATKAKALFDYLYFKFKFIKKITKDDFSSLRLNLENFSEKDLLEFKIYLKKANVKKYFCLSKLIGEEL